MIKIQPGWIEKLVLSLNKPEEELGSVGLLLDLDIIYGFQLLLITHCLLFQRTSSEIVAVSLYVYCRGQGTG